ncbi:arginine--tRNA ligase [Nitrosopumilus sp. b1]|uniref:arginine--tRNA ligase n=1 Tax=Nitrosopumilus sp. b1 TaxID=2109907 RepID=UPI0015F52915|nr:arginine--tRNA ligase [Nitrosopumilus sp. b1]KAF6242945.1 arginine--tRNA ligase [Nitrosopumilus sp. b1]
MSMRKILEEIESTLGVIIKKLGFPNVSFSVEPAKPGFGDISSNVSFLLAKELKRKPFEISQTISQEYNNSPGNYVSKVEPHPSGFVNFLIKPEQLCKLVLKNSTTSDYGHIDIGKKQRIVVEHTSVNPNKALHIGHVRNIIIGDCVSRILKKANYSVSVLNYVDDSGLQVADIVLGFTKLGFPIEPPSGQKFDHYCGDEVYVKTTEKYQNDPKLEEERKNILKEIEEGVSDTASFADSVTKKVLACQLETCWNMDVYYDCLNFESQIIRSGLWKKIFEKLQELKLIEYENDGKNKDCWVIRGDGKEEDKVIVRSNGTATYIAKDIPYAAWKLGLLDDPFYYEKYPVPQTNDRVLWQTTLSKNNNQKQSFAGDKVITVIDSRQSRLQNIITSLMSQFKSNPDAYVHLGYESVTLSSDTAKILGIDTQGKQTQMSGRKGLYVSADSVLELLQGKTFEETKKRNPDLDEKKLDEISKSVAIGTLRYEMIKQDLDKIITFDLTKSLSLEGDTAPYIQYANARAVRILEKSGMKPDFDVSFDDLSSPYEVELVKKIGMYDIQVRDAAKNFSPKVIARYCYDLAVTFNGFYENIKVLDSPDSGIVNQRLCLVESFRNTISNALGLLGIPVTQKM